MKREEKEEESSHEKCCSVVYVIERNLYQICRKIILEKSEKIREREREDFYLLSCSPVIFIVKD